MNRLHRSLAVGAIALLAAACSTDSPTGMDSGLEIQTMTSMDTHPLFEVTLCKSWVGAVEDKPAFGTLFSFTHNGPAGTAQVGMGLCAPIPGGLPAEATITEVLAPGYGVGQIWVITRDGSTTVYCTAASADVNCTTTDLTGSTINFDASVVGTVFFKNTSSDALPLKVEKTAAGTYDRTVSWELTKTVSPSSHMGAPGDEFSSNWTVTATKSEIFGNYEVTGTIMVSNPNTFDVAFSLADVMDDGTIADITCPGTGDNTGTALAGGSVTCAYETAPADGSATLNVATVVFDVGAGETTAIATAGVTFTENLIGDDSVTLSDPRVGYSQLISATTVEIFPEIFTCPADPRVYTDGVYMATYTNTAYLDGANTDLEASAEVTITCKLPPGGGEGCTPGFWRQPQHFQYWTGYNPSDLYSDVFGVARPGTLLQNVTANGGGANALARHSVAALLNAASAEVDYDLSAAEIIAGVQAAFASGDFETFKNVLEGYNEQGCSVDKSN
jgi:hypothetical protein